MKTQENDPDTLQVLDELDKEWVGQWLKATRKKRIEKNELTITIRQEKVSSPILQMKPIFK